MDGVVVLAEGLVGADLVDDQDVAALARELVAGVLEHSPGGVTRLGREADEDGPGSRPAVPHELGQDVGIADEPDLRRGLVVLTVMARLDLVVDIVRRPEVGDGRGHHDHVGVVEALQHGAAKLLGGLHRHDVHARRDGQRGGRHEGHASAAGSGLGRHGIPLLARGAVAQEADRVEGFTGAARRDDDVLAGQRAVSGGRTSSGAGEHSLAHGIQLLRLRETTRAGVLAGEAPGGGRDDVDSTLGEGRDIGLGGCVLPHLGVHRGRHDDRTARREEHVGQQVVGLSGGRAGQQVSGRGGHDDEIGLLPEPDVRDLGDVGPDVGVDVFAGEGGPGRGPDEVQGRSGRHDGDVVPVLGEQAQQGRGLVGCDAARHTEDDAHGGLSPRW